MPREGSSRRAALALVVVGLIASAALTSACDSTPTAQPPSLVTAPPPTPTASDVVDAVSHTRGLGTAALAVEVMTDVDGATRSLTGSGSAALDQDHGTITWTDADGRSTRELSNGRGLFVQTEVPDGRWVRLDDAGSTPTGPLVGPLRGLGGLQHVAEDGHEVMGGVEVTSFTGDLPATAQALQQLGLTVEEQAVMQAAAAGTPIQVTVWIDGGGRVVRVDRSLDLPVGSATTSTTLSRFSDPIDLSPPPTESVDQAPDAQ